MKLGYLAVFGTMGPRPGERLRPATEMLRSTIAAFRKLDPARVHRDDIDALKHLVPVEHAMKLPLLQIALQAGAPDESQEQEIMAACLQVILALLRDLKDKVPVVVTLQVEYGTSLFPRTLADFDSFWDVVH